MGTDNKLATYAYQALCVLCNKYESYFNDNLLQKLCFLLENLPDEVESYKKQRITQGMDKFIIRHSTLNFLDYNKDQTETQTKIEKILTVIIGQEKDYYKKMQHLLFGFFTGAWRFDDMLNKAEDYNSTQEEDLLLSYIFFDKMQLYLSLLKENYLKPDKIGVADKYLYKIRASLRENGESDNFAP
jgi:hypothetical protein